MRNGGVTEKEIARVAPILRRLVWSDGATREKLQKHGVNVIPVDFYSNTPSIDEIRNSYEFKEDVPYQNQNLFNEPFLADMLDQLKEFSSEFDPDTDGDENDADRFFWRNSQFSYSDAMSYYCFVRKFKPARIVEIGSGFSTLVALEATKQNGAGQVTCIEPYPRPFLERIDSLEVLQHKAQDISPDFLNNLLQDGDFVFIDSTHTVKTGSDCLHIYLRLLPQIKRDIFVQVHDIFLPFPMPLDWLLNKQIYWTEQYLLLALLTDNPKIRVLYGSAYHQAFNNEALKALMNNRWASGGGSFWFNYNGSHGC
jgi:Methyltransferase domain